MPVEAKPLFRPDVLRTYLSAFKLPEIDRSILQRWADEIETRKIDRFGEKEILPDFLQDFFVTLLGYIRPTGNTRYTIGFERHVSIDGQFVDAVLGEFNGHQKYLVALEGKGPKDPLDRPYAGRKLSAVDQGYRYAINLECDWIIVTSIKQTRLYHKGSNQQTYERFDTERLAADEHELKKFLFLLGADRVVPEVGTCHFYTLQEESSKVGKDLTKQFYLNYANMRQDAFEQLSRDNPNTPRNDVLSSTQKLLDRVLFVAFCEDRGLLPTESIRKAYEHKDLYHPRGVWENFRALFRAIDQGNPALGIHAYNGGLFAYDSVLDCFDVSDEVCGYFRELGEFDYRPAYEASGETKVIDVDILGHIFEQSITDLERLRNELDGTAEPVGLEQHKTRRKKEGAFYTPSFITRYIVEQALGGVLIGRFETLRVSHQSNAKGAAKKALEEPKVYELSKLTKPVKTSLVNFWEAWQDQLTSIRILDPACGSGAFLIEAFDQMHTAYEHSNDRLAELRGYRSLFDLDKRILENNLFGVDLNAEAVEICRLSLWIKTAEQGKALTSLDNTILTGNSLITDPTVHPKAFDWQSVFPKVFEQGGFDVVIGNPPYVRQELLSQYKPYLQANYKAFHGMADIYVYFYELGLSLLKNNGLLSFIVTNKWMKSGYGEPLRRLFSEQAWIESVVDFGHAKQIFEEADVFPSIIVARKPTESPKPTMARLCMIPREQLRIEDLGRQIETEGMELPLDQLGADAWQLEPPRIPLLMSKIRKNGVPLKDFIGQKPLLGIKSGLNQAFLIDANTRNAIVSEDSRSSQIIKPYLRGQDIERWHPDWNGLWMIAIKSSGDFNWPWTNLSDTAEVVFGREFPAVYRWLKQFEHPLRNRQDKGKFWWELRSCSYWQMFSRPKLCIQGIAFHPRIAFDNSESLLNNSAFILPTEDRWVHACLNSPAMWYYAFRQLPHKKDEALAMDAVCVQELPIPSPTESQRLIAASVVEQLISIASSIRKVQINMLDWLRVEYGIERASLKLQSLTGLDSDALVAEIKKIRGKKNPLTAAALRSLRDEHAQTIEPARIQAAEAMQLEWQLSNLVNEAYGLTPDEVSLLWKTAPPRMPLQPI